jgi:hypothetical protein
MLVKLFAALSLVPVLATAEPQPQRTTALERTLATARLTWSVPAEFASITPTKNRAMEYEIAIKAKKVKLEARYAIRFNTADHARPNAHTVGGSALFQGLITTTILNITAGEDAPVAWFDPKAATAEFGAPEGASATFVPAAAGWTGYKKCMMVAIRKGGAEAYAFFLFDDLDAVAPELKKAFHALRFTADP